MKAAIERSSRGRYGWLGFLALVMVLIYVPVLVVIVLSFNTSIYGTLPFEFTVRWYGELVENQSLLNATVRSLVLSTLVAGAAGVLGTGLALWMVRYARLGSGVFTGLLTTAITIPWLILSVAILLIAFAIGVGRSMATLFLGSLVVALPYVVFVVVARLHGTGHTLEDAARSLGARPLTTFRLVTLPLLSKAIVSGTMLAFIITFNNFPLQHFLAPFGFNTLPMEIFTMVRAGYRPDINALATVVLLFAVTLGAVLILLMRRAGEDRATARLTEMWAPDTPEARTDG